MVDADVFRAVTIIVAFMPVITVTIFSTIIAVLWIGGIQISCWLSMVQRIDFLYRLYHKLCFNGDYDAIHIFYAVYERSSLY